MQTFFVSTNNIYLQVDTLSYKTKSSNAQTVSRKWFIADAEGKTLGRFCSEVAKIVRGKHKPEFTPHADCGDYIIIINAEKIQLNSGKMDTKIYQTYSGYPGGQKDTVAKDRLAKRPTALVEDAVRGMLPKNRLGRKIFHNMKVFAGNEHPHEAQQPEIIEF